MKLTLVVVVVIAVIGIVAYILMTRMYPNQVIVPPTQPTPTPALSVSPIPSNIDELLAGGSSYRDPSGLYVFLYPNDFKFDLQNNGQMARVYKQGPTQQGQTEMYDGVIVTFETVSLNGKSLSAWTDEHIKSVTSDGTSIVTQPKKDITINSYPAFTFKLRGLGEATIYTVQKDLNSPHALLITTLIEDPQNVGFQKEVDGIFSTLQLSK